MTVRLSAICLLLGAAAACGFAPLGWWLITLATLAVLAPIVARARTVGQAAWAGWLFGVGHFCVGLNWIATAFTYQAAMPAWLGWVAVVLLSLYLAVFPALATAFARAAGRTGPAATGVALAAGWIVGERLRATVFTGFAWSPLGVIWAGTPAADLAPYVGTYGLSGLSVLAAGLAWPFVRHLAAEFRAKPLTPGRIAAVMAVFVLPEAIALLLLPLIVASPAPVPATGPRIRIVQPNIGQEDKWREGSEAAHFARLAALTGPPSATPRLVLWPEVAVPAYLEEEPAARAAIAGLLGPRDLLLTGGIALRRGPDGAPLSASNSVFALDPAGRLIGGRYDKAHLVPYGEYLPMRPLLSALGLSRLAPGDLDFRPGPGPGNVVLPDVGAVGVQVCYEIIFSGRVVDRAHRPRLLFNPSNDAWFGRWGPPQHLAQARLRAIEEGLPMVRATPTGISAVIDARGRLLTSLPWRTMGAIDARLPPALPATPFARWGNLLPALLALALAAAAFALAAKRR